MKNIEARKKVMAQNSHKWSELGGRREEGLPVGSWPTTPPPKNGWSKIKNRDFSLDHLHLSPLNRETADLASLWRQKPPDEGLGATQGGALRTLFGDSLIALLFK